MNKLRHFESPSCDNIHHWYRSSNSNACNDKLSVKETEEWVPSGLTDFPDTSSENVVWQVEISQLSQLSIMGRHLEK